MDNQSHSIKSAVIYARVSSKAQVKRGDGLNSQETRCRQYAEFRGYDVVAVFTDDLTGRTSNRPGVNALLSFLKSSKEPFVVIVDDLSRFARSVQAHFELRQAIAKVGGVLETPTLELRNDADGEMHEYILATFAQHQSRKNAEQTVNRMKARVLNGYWPFQPPTGYTHVKSPDGHGKIIVPNEPIASIVREALEGYASGRFDAKVEVKRFLDAQPIFPKYGKAKQIAHQRVQDILENPVYAGYVHAPTWNIPLQQGKHEPLISLETHQNIMERMRTGRKVPARKDLNMDFPLRGFVNCGCCSRPLTACWSKSSTGKRHPYYLCHHKGCSAYRKSIPRDKVEGAFEKMLRELAPAKELNDITLSMFKHVWNIRAEQVEVIKQQFEQEKTKLTQQIEQLVDRIVTSESATAVSAYEDRISRLEKEKLVLEEKQSNWGGPQHSFEEMFERAMQFLANPYNLWISDRLEDKRTVLKLTFSNRLAYCRETGLRTPQVSEPFRFFGSVMSKEKMAHPTRFELMTSAFGGQT
jgi:site-specific DNA recombinase